MKATSQTSSADFLGFLSTICARPEMELEWVDLLSQLEYVGCRKILKAVEFSRVNLEVLRHVHEESFHAYLLKKVVDDSAPNRTWTEGKFSAAGWSYFKTLDARVSALEAERFAYPGVSWIVEKRVLDVYPRYLELTRNPAVKRALTRILAQEKRHGSLFDEVVFPETYRETVLEIEERLWASFIDESTRLLG